VEQGGRYAPDMVLTAGGGPPGPPLNPGTFLAQVGAAARRALLSLGTEVSYADGDALIREGEQTEDVFLLLRGWLKVLGGIDTGREALLAVRIAGDLVGELSAFDGGARIATVRAVGDCRVRRIGRADFRTFLLRHPDAVLAINATVGTKLRLATRRRVEFTSFPPVVRVARVLTELADRHGRSTPEGILLGVALTQPELAALIGAAEPTVHRVLTSLRRDGVLGTGYREVRILDLDRLRALADGERHRS
jgi:CRP/FNR family cyclic AMP-dependent transcriptional regulator